MPRRPDQSQALQTLKQSGQQQLSQGSVELALRDFEQALVFSGNDPELLFYRGFALRQLGRNVEALASYEKALALVPDHPDLLCNYGNALRDVGRLDDALESLDRAVRFAPQVPLFQYNRANLLMALERHDEAVFGFDTTLRLDSGLAEVWNNRGSALLELGRAEDARASFDRALVLDPQYAEALSNRGGAWLELDQPELALADFEAALQLEHGDAETLNRTDVALRRQGSDADAETRFEEALRIDPDRNEINGVPDTWNSMGMALQRLGRLDQAGQYFERALVIDPGFSEALHNRGLLQLYRGHFETAWDDYESRIAVRGYHKHLRNDLKSVAAFRRMPRWQGPASGDNCRVALWAEQGIGDHLLFTTLLPELVSSVDRLVCEVDKRLLHAYRRAFPATEFVAWTDPPDSLLTAADAVLFAGSLPGLFRRDAAAFRHQPLRLLSAQPERVARYQQSLGVDFKIALSWRSTRSGWVGRGKSASLDQFAPLFAVPGVCWVDVQYGDTTEERLQAHERSGIELVHFEDVDYYDDLEAVFAIIEACDLLITTSNANAHFAGVLGKPVWLLYPDETPPFHYWAHDGDHRCRWYPSMEFVTAPGCRQWSQLAALAAERLRQVRERGSFF